MPLDDTPHGKECPLGKWEIDRCGGRGGYNGDPVEKCYSCNFADLTIKNPVIPSDEVCRCPVDMAWGEYKKLQKEYSSSTGKMTRQGFWKYVEENHKK